MSHPPQQKAIPDKSGGKHRATAAMKEPTVQHTGDVFYGGMGPPALESAHRVGEPGGLGSGVFNPEKGPQSLAHYQQTASVKWMHQDHVQASGWSQDAPGPLPTNSWGQNFSPYMDGLNNVRVQMAFPKGSHDGGAALQMGPAEKQAPGSMEVYREATQAQAQARGLEWGQQAAAAAMRPTQLQSFQQGHKGVDLQVQPPHAPSHPSMPPGSLMQSIQLPFGPTKQHLPSGYYPVFQGGTKVMPNLSYNEQPKTQQQHQLMQLQMQQQQQHQQQQKQQQQLHQQQHHHHQQQQQQHQLQQQLQHQMQQYYAQKSGTLRTATQQPLNPQYHKQQLQQEQRQQMHQQQLQPPHSLPPQEILQPQSQQKQQPNQHFLSYNQPPDNCPSRASPSTPQKDMPLSVETQGLGHTPDVETPSTDPSSTPSDPCPPKLTSDPMSPSSDASPAAPRRSRRLSRDGLSPLVDPPSLSPWNQTFREVPQNGVVARLEGGERPGPTGGVIQSTRRKRRASKEINLETLAQKASERESLPSSKIAKQQQQEGLTGRQAGMVPLVIPVSVPVRQGQTALPGTWPHGRPPGQHALLPPQPQHKPSVIVASRRSLRNSLSESFSQDVEGNAGQDDDGKLAKHKWRPRPEPLFIPPPKPATFIAPSVYSAITPYQSHLRSPIRLPDHHFTLPPYTPPPILSPVREGSGLYFSTFLSSIAASNQTLQPPPSTPKSASRSLLRSTSSTDITPPVLPLITDATPVSFEPRINIGLKYQAEVPELQCDLSLTQFDQHKADLVWLPMKESLLRHAEQETVDDLMSLACSSALYGGGTNQELALHCLHECGGNVLETLAFLLLKEPVFFDGHHLADYHYSGSDSWTPSEKRYFNKGISTYRKDFFMVQKLVQTKTVAQCVEFYYMHKKQVKISRSGTVTYGPADSPADRHTEAVVDVKSSQGSKPSQEEVDRKWEGSCDRGQVGNQSKVTQTLQAHDNTGAVLGHRDHDAVHKVGPPHPTPPSATRKPRPEAGKKSRAPPKPPGDPEGVFPCKKCSRVFYKVKSRSAHMKSHAEREKKEAALKLKEEEERAVEAEARAREAAEVMQNGNGGGNGVGEQDEVSDEDVPSETEDEKDEDWQ